MEKLKKGKEIDPYYINILEELNDFDDWCITDNNNWGIPVPHFLEKGTGKIIMDQEIVEHFATLVEEHGSSDIWFTFD